MKELIILTGVSPRASRERQTAPLLRLISYRLRSCRVFIRKHSLLIGVAAGAASFLGILLGLELFGSLMAMVSLPALLTDEKGGAK